jgi:hypothetical protein
MLFVEPIAVAHSPTVSWLAVAFPDFRYLVAELTVTISGPGLTVVVVPSAPFVVEVRPPAKAKRVPCTVMVDPDTAVTLPLAKATVPVGRVTVVRGRLPAPGKVPPVRPPKPPPPNAPPPPPKPRLQVPLVDEKIVTLVAFTAPAKPFEPVAVTHSPTVTSLRLAFRLAVMVVEAVRSTVVWPVSVFCTSRVLPVMLAILPVAAGPNAEAPPGEPAPPALVAAAGVVVVVTGAVVVAGALAALEPPPPQAAASNDMTANKPAADARRRVLPEGISKFVTGLFLLYP